VPGSEFAERTAALLSLAAATEERSLSQLTLLAASQVTGCAAAAVTLWRDGELASEAASHPDAPWLTSVQLSCGRGPVIDALTAEAPISCPDTMTETRWPEFAAAALRIGVRNSVTLSYHGPVVITLTLLGVRPGAVSPDQLQLAELLVAYGSALVGAVADFGDSQRTAVQLRDAATGRAVVDQAKGILMHALGCSADDALERMRDVSQRSNLRATEVARRIVAAYSGRQPNAARADLGALADLTRPRGKSAG
jgi:hypothetical protein